MKIDCTIRGVTPLLMSRFTEEAEVAVSSGTTTVVRGNNKGTPREQAKRKLYVDSKTGELYIPGPNVLACLVAAGRFHKAGREKLSTAKSSLIPAYVLIEEQVCPLTLDGAPIKDPHWEVDSRRVVVPSTGGGIMAHRPRLDEWELSFRVDLDAEFSSKLFREVVDSAGRKCGLGDFRPSRKGPYGRFSVVNWKESNGK